MTKKTWRMTTSRPEHYRLLSTSFWNFRRILSISSILLAGTAAGAFVIAAAEAPPQHHKPSPNDCLLYVTVFTEDGHLLPGADAEVHPVGKKKPNWEATSDGRGEFAIRVPPDSDYEIDVKAKGFVAQTRTVTAQTGDRQDLVFNMPYQPKKK
jgi:hypothetical protein